MANKLWKKFDKLTEESYENMIGLGQDASCWQQAFEVLTDIIRAGREEDRDYAPELYCLDDMTDYVHDISGWMEDYLDEMDMRKEYQVLLDSCNWLLENFRWEEESPSDLYFRKSVVLRDLGQKEESDHFCEVWRDREPDNIYAIAASIYAKIEIRDLDAAQRLVESCIDDETECNDENDILFTAAEKVYGLTGNKKKLKKVKKALETYEELLERYMMGMDEEEDLDDPDLWELPFS